MLKHGIFGLLNYGNMTVYGVREVFGKSLNFFRQAHAARYTGNRARSKKRLEKSTPPRA